MRLLLLVVLVGCTPKLQWGARRDTFTPWGTCAATTKVRVVDVRGGPVPGAEVFVRRRAHTRAPSMAPKDEVYETVPVVTNAHGEARTCSPGSIPTPRDAYFTRYSDGAIVARVNGRESVPGGPFSGLLRIP